jgi:hypothetical protein
MVDKNTKNRVRILGRNNWGDWHWAPANTMRTKSKKSDERQRGTSDESGSGKDLGNYTGFAHSRFAAHFRAALTGYSTSAYDPISAFLSTRLFKLLPQVAKY